MYLTIAGALRRAGARRPHRLFFVAAALIVALAHCAGSRADRTCDGPGHRHPGRRRRQCDGDADFIRGPARGVAHGWRRKVLVRPGRGGHLHPSGRCAGVRSLEPERDRLGIAGAGERHAAGRRAARRGQRGRQRGHDARRTRAVRLTPGTDAARDTGQHLHPPGRDDPRAWSRRRLSRARRRPSASPTGATPATAATGSPRAGSATPGR